MLDHGWLSRTRTRLLLEIHDAMSTWVLQRLAKRGLVQDEWIGVNVLTMETNEVSNSALSNSTMHRANQATTAGATAVPGNLPGHSLSELNHFSERFSC